jgi:hypothetical protein
MTSTRALTACPHCGAKFFPEWDNEPGDRESREAYHYERCPVLIAAAKMVVEMKRLDPSLWLATIAVVCNVFVSGTLDEMEKPDAASR